MEDGRPSLTEGLFVDYWVSQTPHAFDADFNHISGDHRSDATGSAGRDQITGNKRHCLRNISHDDTERKNEIPGIALLSNRSVYSRLNPNSGPRINLVRHHRANRAKTVEAFGAGPLTVFVLQIARSHIVEAGIAKNVGTRIFIRAQLVAFPANHNCELPFEVDTLRKLWPTDFAAGRKQGRRRFEEEQRLTRYFIAQLGSVLAIVAAYTHDLRRRTGASNLASAKLSGSMRLEGRS